MALWEQLAQQLRADIAAGRWAEGEPLPSERSMEVTHGVSRTAIRRAIQHLRDEGLVRTEHGRGLFVNVPPTIERLARTRLAREARAENRGAFLGDAARQGFTASSSVKVWFEPADERTASLLGIEPGAEVCVRDRVMRADGEPVMLATSRLPRDITAGTVMEDVDTGVGGLYSRIEDAGHRLVDYTEDVGARRPTPAERQMLGLADSAVVLSVTRIARAESRVVEINDMVMAADRYRLTYTWAAD